VAGGGGDGEAAEAAALKFTPMWIVAAACSLIVLISLASERCLHYLGKVSNHRFKLLLAFRFSHDPVLRSL
jgi:hypothetical protein